MSSFVKVLVKDSACNRTKERFLRFGRIMHRIELLESKMNENLCGDGFEFGHSMSYFGIDKFDAEQNLWARAWEGWIPDCDIEIIKDN